MKKNSGFTFIELLVVMAILAILAVGVIFGLSSQIAKAHDAERKNDLQSLKTALRAYYDDRGRYPTVDQMTCKSTVLSPFLEEVPCDPTNSGRHVYTYISEQPNQYAVFVDLEFTADPGISALGCTEGCGPDAMNYYVSSDNVTYSTSTSNEEGILPNCPSNKAPAADRYCYANVCSSCCPGVGYRCDRHGTRCLLDTTCIPPTPTPTQVPTPTP